MTSASQENTEIKTNSANTSHTGKAE